jgi:hypothetical protein
VGGKGGEVEIREVNITYGLCTAAATVATASSSQVSGRDLTERERELKISAFFKNDPCIVKCP